jgi:hypothetical protein
MRLGVGIIGVLLPVVLLVGDAFFIDGKALPRGSLSAYYHSGVRDFFVGVLCATAVFLLCYRVAEHSVDIRSAELTSIQLTLTENVVSFIHALCAGVFIVSLGVISYLFGRREGGRLEREGQRVSPKNWKRFHFACAGLIAVAVAFIIVTKLFKVFDDYSLLIGESVAVFAFGASWFAKGTEKIPG